MLDSYHLRIARSSVAKNNPSQLDHRNDLPVSLICSSIDAKRSTMTSNNGSGNEAGYFGSPPQVGMIVPTVSEDEQQGLRTNGEHLTSLPRSVRWRIQLGLLQDPSDDDTVPNTDKDGDDKHICNLETLSNYNLGVIVKQAERFKGLVEKHVETATEDEKETHDLSPSSAESNEIDSANNTAKPAEIDPLTAMVMEKEAQETRKAELYLKYRKERARMKRGLATEAHVIESESDEVDRASVSSIG